MDKRNIIQASWSIATNSYFIGFIRGRIYRGSLKRLCVPGLNCYSCPGALGACPIGAMQAVIGGRQYQMSLFIAGFFMMVGALCGRFICGFFCPFGLVQELIYKIPFARKLNRFRGDRALRWLKYVILILFVILLPMLAVDAIGLASPWFCKYICPSGTLFAGIPLALANGSIRAALGNLFAWKMFVLAALVMLSVIIYRPFCKYLCPLGAVYALFNRIAFARMEVDSGACVRCEACSGICKMGCTPYINPNDTECVRCGDCVRSCPCSALSMKPYIKRGRQSAARSK